MASSVIKKPLRLINAGEITFPFNVPNDGFIELHVTPTSNALWKFYMKDTGVPGTTWTHVASGYGVDRGTACWPVTAGSTLSEEQKTNISNILARYWKLE